ncbi:Cytochrome P450 4F12 [Acropora cervicornis]|uniref:Cytochrome P450 4F12 n=1 Tax=Acropora cervicornis TaxID=6130 RepID=A0AAD9V0J3_ACRCE|nr:Cytochrome P450 4F12 [Acropora cervicornis]
MEAFCLQDEDGNALTDKEIRAEVVTFFSAGQDTVAAGISWTLYNLALYSQHQEKCKEEIDEVFADKKEIEWDDLVKLNYVTLVIKESMRLYPPVPMFSRGLDKSYEIDGKVVPQGTWIMINAYALHHNPHVWKDPEVFDPLRFTTENREGRSPFELSISMENQVHSEDLFPEVMLRTRNGIRLNLVPRY